MRDVTGKKKLLGRSVRGTEQEADQQRRQILDKFHRMLLDGIPVKDAANAVGYSDYTLACWEKRFKI